MLGVIQVDYFRTTVVNEGVAGNVAQQNFREIGPVSERTKKAGVHHVAYVKFALIYAVCL